MKTGPKARPIPKQPAIRFSIIPARAVDDPRLRKSALLVLMALGTYSDPKGWCWPSVETIGHRLRVGVRHVKRGIQDLERLGYLETQHRYADDGAELSARRRIIFDEELPADITEKLYGDDSPTGGWSGTPPRGGVGDHRGGGQNGARGGGLLDHPNDPRNVPLERTTRDAARDDSFAKQFDQFWQIFPSRRPHSNPKKPAATKFAAAVRRGVPAEIIIKGATNYRAYAEAENTDPKYIAQAVTWLNEERWADYQEPPARTPSRPPGMC